MIQQTNEIPQTVSAILDELGARFGETGVHLWQALVQHEFMTGLSIVIGLSITLGLLFCFTFGGLIHASLIREHKDADDIFGWGFATAAIGLIILICLTINLPSLLAPEGAVLRSLLS